MEVLTHTLVEFEVEVEGKKFSLQVPHGVAIDDGIRACGYFMSVLSQEKEKALLQEKEKAEEKDSENEEKAKE